ncbi:MAG: hypothetical protein KatS3mg119_0894 [Rhodothalassiaceae bacterium]|nr:MAG: hypothetical protein KatS3mg119_0894 [Rhodothalassiaceae bacterium]
MNTKTRHPDCIIFTREWDDHAVALKLRLSQIGISSRVVSWSNFPSNHRASISFSGRGETSIPLNLSIHPDQICHAKLFIFRKLPARNFSFCISANDVEFAKSETESFILGAYAIIAEKYRCINNPISGWLASSKPFQIELAQQIGFNIPSTIITNDPSKALQFLRDHPCGVVAKSMRPGMWITKNGNVVPTLARVINSEDIERNRSSILQCPVIFQEYISDGKDIRIVVIGRNVFSAYIKRRSIDYLTPDWKIEYYLNRNILIEPIYIPDDISYLCIKLTRGLNLDYCVIDLRRDSNGRIYFLEINPYGQWLWMDMVNNKFPLLDCFAKYVAKLLDINIKSCEKMHSIANYLKRETIINEARLTFSGESEEKTFFYFE